MFEITGFEIADDFSIQTLYQNEGKWKSFEIAGSRDSGCQLFMFFSYTAEEP